LYYTRLSDLLEKIEFFSLSDGISAPPRFSGAGLFPAEKFLKFPEYQNFAVKILLDSKI